MQDLNNISGENIQQNRILHGLTLMVKDMRFVGLFTILYGILNCITIIGAIIGIPLIFMGIRLRESADHYDYFNSTGDMQALQNAIDKQYKYFNIQKILIIVSLIFLVLYAFAVFSFFSMIDFSNSDEIFSLMNSVS